MPTIHEHVMSEAEADLLHHKCQEFHDAYARLVGETVAKVPDRLESLFVVMLQERSNVFSVDFRQYIKRGKHGARRPRKAR